MFKDLDDIHDTGNRVGGKDYKKYRVQFSSYIYLGI